MTRLTNSLSFGFSEKHSVFVVRHTWKWQSLAVSGLSEGALAPYSFAGLSRAFFFWATIFFEDISQRRRHLADPRRLARRSELPFQVTPETF